MKADHEKRRAQIALARKHLQESNLTMSKQSEKARSDLQALQSECAELRRAERDQDQR